MDKIELDYATRIRLSWLYQEWKHTRTNYRFWDWLTIKFFDTLDIDVSKALSSDITLVQLIGFPALGSV